MIKCFDKTGIFTTQNPEIFLNFIGNGDSSLIFKIRPDVSLAVDSLYINGIESNSYRSPSEGYNLRIDSEASIASFHLYTRELEDFDCNLIIDASGHIQLVDNWTAFGSVILPKGPTDDRFIYKGIINNDPGISASYIVSNLFTPINDSSLIITVDISMYEFSVMPKFYVYENSVGYVMDNCIGIFTQYPLVQGINVINYPFQDSSNYIYLKFDQSTNTIPLYSTFIATVDAVQYGFQIYDVSVFNRKTIVDPKDINVYETSNVQADNETSYLVIRTNPKFTGNIKLVLDTSDNLFLDTFKVSDILNNKIYRKQKVSSESFLSGDIRRVFSSLPAGEVYRIDQEDTLNISFPKTTYNSQYNLNYSYGARLLQDELYEQDYSMLAPLWINNKIPDYFVVFRLDGVYNEETYNNDSLSNLAAKYIENGELIKTWGMKDNTPIGNYLKNHLNELLTVRSPMFLSLSDPDTTKDPDPNTWYGIALDKGIITGRSETTYNFDKNTNFTDMNAFVSLGFDRLKLLCPNLINMEYVFSDEDVSMYSMHRYYGLYLTDNELYKISYSSETEDGSINILSLDGRESSIFFNSYIFDASSGDVADVYKTRIFSINDKQEIKRITAKSDANGENREFISKWVNKPGDQLFSVDVEEKTSNKFMTIKLNNLLYQGEHLRVVDKSQYRVWEIIGVYSDLLPAGTSWPYATVYTVDASYPIIYRTTFSTKGDKSDQIRAIKNAFDLFSQYDNTPFRTTIVKEDIYQLSLEIEDTFNSNDMWFQRITSQTVNDINDASSLFNTSANYDDIKFFGVLDPSVSDFERLRYDASYGPLGVEIFGDRMSISVNFLDSSTYRLYSFSSSVEDKFEQFILYRSTNSMYKLLKPFVIHTTVPHSYNYVTDPDELDDNLVVQTVDPIYRVNGKWNAYNTYPLSISLMGINPVKDIDYIVYDSSLGFESEYSYAREDDPSTYSLTILEDASFNVKVRNSYMLIAGNGNITINNETKDFAATPEEPFVFNTFEHDAKIISKSNSTVLTYNQIDGVGNYTAFTIDPQRSEEYIDNYYLSSTKDRLRYGLTVPYISKWVGLGDDCRTNPMRLNLMLDSCIYDSSSNFIVHDNFYEGEISYPVFKYLDSGDRAWENYIFYDVNDVIRYTQDGSILYATIKDLMLENMYVDMFSKLMYSNHNICSIKLRSSVAYYNNYKNSIDAIINGLNLSFSLDENSKNIFDVKDWDRFRISMISTSSKNRDNNYPLEVIINENTDTILIIWYQGSDVLNYTKRNSTTVGAKSLLQYDASNNRWYQGFNESQSKWNFIKAPYLINHASLSTDTINIYDHLSTYDASSSNLLCQLNWNTSSQINSVFNAFSSNLVLSNSFQFYNTQFNTFDGYINYTYIRNVSSYGTNIFNYSYLYTNNNNLYANKACSLDLLKYLININRVGYYIIREETLYTNDNFSSPPIIMAVKDPKLYKGIYNYNGWFKPKFNNILDFACNEDSSLSQVISKDFILSNTNLKQYRNIPQLWYNKVIDNISSYDTSIKDAIGFIKEYNVFKSQWDADYYVLENYASPKVYVDGYNASQELPSYFGSKLIKLPDTLDLEEWDVNTTNTTQLTERYTLEYNITRKILNIFTSSGDFTSNWDGLTSSDNVVNAYVKKTIIEYYNISKNKISVEMWTKPFDGNLIAYALDDSFTQNTGINIDSNLVFINNEYVYKINVNALPSLTYFFKFRLFEK